uniref:Uncharacterized protein n=1 Tax=uncultured Caudovirales phage TaxID=2100421 RepID=A0A6J5L104_9CAUD|nr:hypothetical protein UFOVP114_3 [uncultured Caudovirales phage]
MNTSKPDRSPGWAHRTVASRLPSPTSTHLSQMTLMYELGRELIRAAEWAAEGIEQQALGNHKAALEARETAQLSVDRVSDMLPDCRGSLLKARRASEAKTGSERKPSNLWHAECGRLTRAVSKPKCGHGNFLRNCAVCHREYHGY